MLSFERQKQIQVILEQKKSATVDYLCRQTYSSPATIRRDLKQLEEEGLLIRVRGGAVIVEGGNHDTPYLFRLNQNADAKKKIASLALQHIKNGNTLFMDSSSTVATLAAMLGSFRDLTVVTNGIAILNELNENTSAKIISCGGVIRNHTTITGSHVTDMLENYYADLLFLSCGGIHPEAGVTEADEEHAFIKNEMIKHAKKVILLCDSSKFDKTYFCRICDWNAIDVLITDKKPNWILPAIHDVEY